MKFKIQFTRYLKLQFVKLTSQLVFKITQIVWTGTLLTFYFLPPLAVRLRNDLAFDAFDPLSSSSFTSTCDLLPATELASSDSLPTVSALALALRLAASAGGR